jgi:outer membrane protein OmpU
MKSILLTTTAIFAFAGVAFADGHTSVGFSGDAGLGYNDDFEDGFYWDVNVDVKGTAALDNGITATVSAELNVASDDTASTETTTAQFDELKIVLSSEMASLSFGNLDPVAEANYGGVDGDSTLGFNDKDNHLDDLDFDAMLVGEVNVSGVTAMMSYGVALDENAPNGEALDALQLYATGSFGMVTVEGAYQGEIGDDGTSLMGLSASTTVAGATITGAYLGESGTANEESSMGLGVSYPVGPVTVGGYYSVNDVAENSYGASASYADGPIAVDAFYDFEGGATDADTDDFSEFGVEGSYDTGMNLTVLAGYIATDASGVETTANYVAGVYDMGGGASILVSYAEQEDAGADQDEIGDPEYLAGTTVKVSFKF